VTPPPIHESERLALRLARHADAAFLLRLMNQPSWLRNIGDRKVHTLEDAARYVEARLLAPARALGYGMYVIERRQDGAAVGLCGLVKRDTLPDPDLGFALLDEHAGHGYALEAASAVLSHARGTLRLQRVLAIVAPANHRSARLLLKLGFRREDHPHLTPEGERLDLYST
jgi:ribosomal-protein-alanine N-acetyltransferase